MQEAHFKEKLLVQADLSRSLVSFQANKTRAVYRWYKFKEAFSASLVEYLFEKYHIFDSIILDPFAGSGTALFAASARGINADGIEILPVGHQIIRSKQILESSLKEEDVNTLKRWRDTFPWEKEEKRKLLPELKITRGAYPEQTKDAIELYMELSGQENEQVQTILHFALLCVLESVSFTRKDGQYLRWDHRSGRRHGKKPFNKGEIKELGYPFDSCILNI